MSEPCIFCENNSGGREHLWQKWIHERKEFGPSRGQRGTSEEKIIPNPEVTVKTVCGTAAKVVVAIPAFQGSFEDLRVMLRS